MKRLWLKLARDLAKSPERLFMMLGALFVAFLGFNTITGAGSILRREIVRSYVDSAPASVTIDFDAVDERLLQQMRARPDVQAVERRKQLMARVRLGDEAQERRAFLFVVEDFSRMSLAKLKVQEGALPSKSGELLVERSSRLVAPLSVGTTLSLTLPSGKTHQAKVGGIVHEPALAPANTEEALYLYASRETVEGWGEIFHFDELRFTPRAGVDQPLALAQFAREIEGWARQKGHIPLSIRIPPPGQHPHQSQMTTVLALLSVFAFLVVVLSSLLSASLFSTFLSRQVREIAVLKTLGASSSQLIFAFFVTIQSLAFLAALPAHLLGTAFGARLAEKLAKLLNFDLGTDAVSPDALALQLMVALSLPLLASGPIVVSACRTTVKSALSNYEVALLSPKRGWVEALLFRIAKNNQALAFALRGAFRRRRRFLLAFSLMAVAGATLLASLSMSEAWQRVIEKVSDSRHYDLEVHFLSPPNERETLGLMRVQTEVETAEIWKQIRTARSQHSGIPIEHIYPDGGHGAYRLVAPPDEHSLISFKLSAGRFVNDEELGSVVLNQLAPGVSQMELGETLSLSVAGQVRPFVLVGKVEEVGVGATAYTNRRTFDGVTEGAEAESLLRLALSPAAQAKLASSTKRIRAALADSGARVEALLPLALYENAIAAHFQILIDSLLALALMTALVGGLGLASALISSIVERTRETAVLRAIGATQRQVKAIVFWEGASVSLLSALAALALGTALAFLVGDLVGQMSFKLSLPVVFNAKTFWLFFLGLGALTYLASFFAAKRALSLSLREALDAF